MSKKTQNGCSLCESLLRKTFGNVQKKRKSEPQKRKMEFRDIPISDSVNVGDVVYTKGKAVIDIGVVKNVHPLEVYSRCAKHDICNVNMSSQHGEAELCHWYNSGVNVSMQQWKRISANAGTEEVCRRIGIPYLREW